MAAFVPGLDVCERFYTERVAPLLAGVPHAAARIGTGSDVLGLDTRRSTDHGWGEQVVVFGDAAVDLAGVTVTTVAAFAVDHVGFDATAGVTTVDWLATPQQKLLEVTAGRVFHDGVGELTAMRARLARYPDDVWLYALACQWMRIGQEEAFVGRALDVGDALGHRVLVGRLVRDVMRLAFLVERTYAPYSKWLGSAFARLDAAGDVGPLLERATDGDSESLVLACAAMGERCNALGVTRVVDPTPRQFYTRPWDVVDAERFAYAFQEEIGDPWLRRLPLVGTVDQFVDSTDVLSVPGRARAAAMALYA